MFQIAERATGIQQAVDFGVECTLALVHNMMDRKAGDDSIKLAQVRESVVEVVG